MILASMKVDIVKREATARFCMLSSNWISVVLLAGAPLAWLQAIAYGLASIRPDSRATAGRLALLFFCMGCWHLEGSFVKTGWIDAYPFVKFAAIPFVFWTGPLAFQYFRELLRPEHATTHRDVWHFFPGILVCGVWYYLAGVDSETRSRFALMDASLDAVLYLRTLNTLGVATGVAYACYVAVRFVYPGRPHWSSGRRILSITLAGLLCVVLVMEFFRGLDLYWRASLFLFAHSLFLALLIVLRIAYPGLMRSFAGSIRQNLERRRRLANRDTDALRAELLRIMGEERVYLNEALSLNDLGDYLGLTAAQTSELINREFGKNFNGFINDYRLDAFAERLLERSDESVLDAGLACGFGSSSSLQALFKARTGLSPGQYRKKFGAG